ncbi:PIN domain-containing protein [candidate division CSSED10-310 bacterium]|uniref:PIN domain-containing protein n=1 Tax=candidate division CSSED10-310 bacterium TaxID=2855610 RepID=A0ABV6Z4Q5_UNCC1
MKVIVDTCIWSLAFRRSVDANHEIVNELQELIKEFKVQLIGPIRQELLSGIKSEKQFQTLKQRLRAFPDLEIKCGDYESAARYFNQCRKNGIQGSNTDFLICALSIQHNMAIFTTDEDFHYFQKLLLINLHSSRF